MTRAQQRLYLNELIDMQKRDVRFMADAAGVAWSDKDGRRKFYHTYRPNEEPIKKGPDPLHGKALELSRQIEKDLAGGF